MDIQDFRKLSARVREDVGLMKAIVSKETSSARVLIDQEVHTEFADAMLKIGSDLATAEYLWRQFGLISPASKKMSVITKTT